MRGPRKGERETEKMSFRHFVSGNSLVSAAKVSRTNGKANIVSYQQKTIILSFCYFIILHLPQTYLRGESCL